MERLFVINFIKLISQVKTIAYIIYLNVDYHKVVKHSLVGCMDCHNPVDANGQAASYGDAQHFCSECHAYASVKIDCFECHADRGYGAASGGVSANAWDDDGTALTAATLQHSLEAADVD